MLGFQPGFLMAWESSSNENADLDLEGEKRKFFHYEEKCGKGGMRLWTTRSSKGIPDYCRELDWMTFKGPSQNHPELMEQEHKIPAQL